MRGLLRLLRVRTRWGQAAQPATVRRGAGPCKNRVSVATAAFVILALATVSFDGFQDTETWVNLRTSMLSFSTSDVVDTVALALAPALFAVVYLAFAWGIKTLSREESGVIEVASAYVFSLVPIALAYNLAHFITLLLIQGQLIIPLASDPFGFGWDIFGTADYRLNLEIISAKAVWFISLDRHRAGPRDLRVPGARDLAAARVELVGCAQGSGPNAGADDRLHRHQPLDNRPANSRG